MKDRILIVTLPGEYNFGNRLQNYALMKTLQKYEYVVDCLFVFPPKKITITMKGKTIIKRVLSLCGVKKYRIKYAQSKRMLKFLEFRDLYFNNIKYIPYERIFASDWSKYRFVIAGSDQVWHNWKKISNELAYYYLEFVESDKRVSYAPSFGFSAFPIEDVESHRKGLMGIKALSCREQEGCNIIKELTGRKATKVLDPTLLFGKEEWQEIEKKPDFSIREEYLLVFFIADISRDYQIEINRISKERDLRIININDPLDPIHYSISPDEFVWLIHHADTVCTDSFHASVFSIIFGCNLRVFKRIGRFTDMFGRLYDLLAPLGLLELVYGYGMRLSSALNSESLSVLQREKEKSLQYLQCALR